MSFEILLSDTARADLERGPHPMIQTLLDRISVSAQHDHTLSAPESEFELRYQSLGNHYVFFRRTEAQVTIVYFCEMTTPPPAIPVEPTLRLVDHKSREVPHGMEIESVMEMTNSDGSKAIHHQLARKIDMGDTYMLIRHSHQGTMIMSGKKGRIDGDFRHDELEMLQLLPDGSFKRFPPVEPPIWIKNPFEGDGRALDERVRDYLQSPMFKDRLEAARKWMSLG